MADQPRVEITLLGQTLSLRSDADPKYLRSLAASLEITDELHRARDQQVKESGDVAARLGALVDQLNRAMSDSPRRG